MFCVNATRYSDATFLGWPRVRTDVCEHGLGEILAGLWVLLLEFKRTGNQVLNDAVRPTGAATRADYRLTLATVVKQMECGAGNVVKRDLMDAITHPWNRPCP